MSATIENRNENQKNAHWWDALPGGTVIWIVVVAELLTFAMFFVAYAAGYSADPDIYRDSQATLPVLSGTINTAVLLTGSWMVARAALAIEERRPAAAWLVGTALSGVVFTVIKFAEYGHTLEGGITMSTNNYWFYYIFLTLMHLMHVLFGIVFAAMMAWKVRRLDAYAENAGAVEATATYWHLVDLIWILLFPLLYLVGAQ